MSASHMVRSFSNASRIPSHHQPASPPHQQHDIMSPLNHSVEYRQSPHQPHLRAASTYESSQLIANESQLDPALLAHENPNNCSDLASPLPLDQYKLNIDRSPLVVRRKPQEKVHFTQKVAVRYLKPPPPPKCGDIVVCELPSKQIAPAPALVVRQAPPKPSTPPPLIIREAPPPPPCQAESRLLHVPGRVLPPPARKVVVERLPPIPQKPQQIFIERWLPYCQPQQRVVYRPAKPICCIPDPKNVVVQWESPDVEIRREVRNLGIHVTDPNEYIRRHGASLIRSQHLPDIAHKFSHRDDIKLAANYQPPLGPIFEGDVHALQLVDLAQNGLLFSHTKHPVYPCFQTSATLGNTGSASPILLRSPPPPHPHTINLSSNLPAEVAAATSAAADAVSASAVGINATSMTIDEVYLTSDQQHHSTTHESILTNALLNNTLSS